MAIEVNNLTIPGLFGGFNKSNFFHHALPIVAFGFFLLLNDNTYDDAMRVNKLNREFKGKPKMLVWEFMQHMLTASA